MKEAVIQAVQISLSQHRGKPLVIDLSPRTSLKKISADDLMALQTRLGLSFNAISEVATFIRIAERD